MADGVIWYYDTLTPHLARLAVEAEAGLVAITHEFAGRVEEHAQSNAPWEDRTGNARDGLHAWAENGVFRHIIWLAHSVSYGIWLEVRWSGRFAIIVPTIEVMGPQLMHELEFGSILI